jgi:flagellar motor switch protein FliG
MREPEEGARDLIWHDLSGQEVAAEFLIAMGEQVAAELIGHLGVSEINIAVEGLAAVRGVPHHRAQEISDWIQRRLQTGDFEHVGSQALADSVLERADLSPAVRHQLNVGESGIDTFARLPVDHVVRLIWSEHPQTIALVLSRLDPERASAILGLLPGPRRPDITRRIAELGLVDDQALATVQQELSGVDYREAAIDVGGVEGGGRHPQPL